MAFPCEWCGQEHADAVQVKHGGGVLEYGPACVIELARWVDGLNLGLVQVELRNENDPVRRLFLVQRRDAILARPTVRRRERRSEGERRSSS